MCVQLAGMPGPLDAKGRGHWGEDENGQRVCSSQQLRTTIQLHMMVMEAKK